MKKITIAGVPFYQVALSSKDAAKIGLGIGVAYSAMQLAIYGGMQAYDSIRRAQNRNPGPADPSSDDPVVAELFAQQSRLLQAVTRARGRERISDGEAVGLIASTLNIPSRSAFRMLQEQQAVNAGEAL